MGLSFQFKLCDLSMQRNQWKSSCLSGSQRQHTQLVREVVVRRARHNSLLSRALTGLFVIGLRILLVQHVSVNHGVMSSVFRLGAQVRMETRGHHLQLENQFEESEMFAGRA